MTTKSELHGICDRINANMQRLGKRAGYYVQYAYGSPRLEQYLGPGARDVSPRLSPGELSRWMYAFLDGIDAVTDERKVQ